MFSILIVVMIPQGYINAQTQQNAYLNIYNFLHTNYNSIKLRGKQQV